MSQLLTTRQAEELHKSIIAYLISGVKLPASAAALRQELEIGDGFDEATSKKYEGVLEKKWTSVVRLQKKIMELESRNASLQSELDSATPTSLSRRNQDPTSWLPRSPARHTLQSHRSPVNCVAFHPIFSSLASGSEDATLKIWDWELAELEKTLKGHTKAVLDCDFGGPRGGTLLASCSSDLTIKLWDPSDDYKNIRTLPGHDHSVSAVRFVPSGAAGAPASGNLLVSASRDKSLRIWDVTTGYCVKTLRGHADWVRDVAPSFDGRWLLSAGTDQTARLWDASSGETRATFIGHENAIECCTFAPAASYVHLAGLAGLKKPPAASSSGEFLATGSRDKNIKLWDSRGTLIKTLIGHDNWVRGLVFHPGGKYLLSVSDDKTIRCWDLAQEGKCVKTVDESHEHFVSCIRWAPSVIKAPTVPNGDSNAVGKKDDPGPKESIRVSSPSARGYNVLRYFGSSSALPQQAEPPAAASEDEASDGAPDIAAEKTREQGAMSRRLAEMTDETIEQGGRSAQTAVGESGFSEELKRQLEQKILDSRFKSDNSAAFAQLNMPSSAGKGTQSIATAQPWAGNESLEDSTLRMLNDVHKPLRGTGAPKIPMPRGLPMSVDMRMKNAVKASQGHRLANARDRTSIYALSQDPNLTEREKEQMRKQLKEKFTPGARPMPTSVQGLAALANERIEDAIARGHFKNIARGKGTNIERDYTASSPFLDTTEYFMNKIIQKQEIVPPWIEKQQELIKAAQTFRSRLRADWKRHAARVIASKGGSLEAQVRRAEAYAAAEAAINPKAPKVEALSEIDNEGKISQVTVTETLTPAGPTQDAKITVTEDLASSSTPPDSAPSTSANSADLPSTTTSTSEPSPPTPKPHPSPALPSLPPLRDPAWQSLERAYNTLAISNLNSLARSYNLMAPSLAKKPYYSLSRELASCFADVAPQLPNEIRARARAPERVRVEVVGHTEGGVLERFAGEKVKVWDSRRPHYGFKEFWRDLWG